MPMIEADKYIVPIVDIVPTPDLKRIESIQFLGTGFFISPQILMTCKHVITNAKNTVCVVSKHGTMIDKATSETFNGLVDVKTHPYADIALAKIGKEAVGSYLPLQVELSADLFAGKDVVNYSYTGYPYDFFSKLWLTPRFFKGYITRISVDHRDHRQAYIELNFPSLLGMSGSPILDNNGCVIGVIYKNFRTQIAEDYIDEYSLTDGETKLTEARTTYKVIDYAQAVDLTKYPEFITSGLGL